MDSLLKILDILNKGWVGALIGLFGVLIAIYQTYRRKIPGIAYQASGQRIIRHPRTLKRRVQVKFDDVEITDLSSTQILIWNSGSTSIRREDIVGKDRITIEFSESTRVFEATIAAVTRKENGFELKADFQSPSKVIADFEFLDPADGVALRILHSGTFDKIPKIRGTVVGAKEILYRGAFDLSTQLRISARKPKFLLRVAMFIYSYLFSILLLIVGAFFILISYYYIEVDRFFDELNKRTSYFSSYLAFIFGMILLFIGTINLLRPRSKNLNLNVVERDLPAHPLTIDHSAEAEVIQPKIISRRKTKS
ncbi:MAG: hypothetical protein AB7P20_05255 [Rhizobiaceae bacterium]